MWCMYNYILTPKVLIMASISVEGTLDITIGGSSYGFTCPFQTNVTCCSSNGTYTFFYAAGGGISVCPPGGPSWDKNITWADLCGLNNPPDTGAQKVFCDPCVNRCSKDGCGGKYTGNYKWLFEMYVNKSNNPVAIPLKTFSVSGGVDDDNLGAGCGTGKLCVNGTCLCCKDDSYATVDLGEISIDLQTLLKAHVQPYINVENGQDPESVCSCYCAGCGPNIQMSCGEDLNYILNIMREVESQNCSAICS